MAGNGVILLLCFLLLCILSAAGRLVLYYGQQRLASTPESLAGRILHYYQDHSAQFYAAVILGSTLAILFFSFTTAAIVRGFFLSENIATGDWMRLGIIAASFIVAGNVLLLGGIYLPQRIVRFMQRRAWQFLWLPVSLCFIALLPVTAILMVIQRGLRRSSPGIFTPWLGNPVFAARSTTEGGPNQAMEEMEIDQEILQKAIEFPSLRVRDCMIPRTDISAVDAADPIEIVKQHFITTGHSRLLVYEGNVDNITGYIHLVDLYKKPSSIEKIVMPITIASEQMPAGDLLRTMIEKRRTIALVVDEFGGTSGLVTIEDLMEEIIGDIEDEYDVDDNTEKKISDSEYIFSARLEIEYLNEKYGLGFPEGDYDTLGGLIFFVHQNIARPGDVITLPRFELTVLSTEQARINEVRVKVGR